MIKIGILCFLAVIILAAGEEYYKDPPRKVVYVEEPEQDYKIVRYEPNFRSYESRKPVQKKVYIVQPGEERKVYLRPSYEPKNKDVVVKILDRKH
ncbi:unnamed protein product [Ceutorhynchus assimilis]|uniref:Uncharacterized protein n=1 Tax=Ceutorhynchus assimilis TaxID=467358 RepID=A0A9N9QPN0_9CUCU|nr:unnamed protein product [Ceutorhynchus assimilis]